MNLQEQSCWLLLAFESKLGTRVVNDILVIWCKQLGRTLQEFFETDAQEWKAVCHLKDDIIQQLEQAKEKLVAQAFLAEQLEHDAIHMMTVLDPEYPKLLKSALTRSQIPSVLFYAGDLDILKRQTIAIIGSRNASKTSLAFTRATASYLADYGANVISGHARGVDRAAYEGATSVNGCTTVVLPHGVHKLSKVQMRDLRAGIEAGRVLLLSQFHPDASWLVSRAMERNLVVTGLAQVVIVAESDCKGGTWEGANKALKQGRRLYVCHTESPDVLPGNKLLLEKSNRPLIWPTDNLAAVLAPLLQESNNLREKQNSSLNSSTQLSLLAVSNE
ncbi:MAG: DNA-processing protein DprA [Ktedonobacteraceae bacterium]|nr:DNA-processing protein DprA [Ktedonobacteraceae bacterium]MBV9021680.1 DNA-processing protein DprA [Ktedonobacteraceae bacterium]